MNVQEVFAHVEAAGGFIFRDGRRLFVYPTDLATDEVRQMVSENAQDILLALVAEEWGICWQIQPNRIH